MRVLEQIIRKKGLFHILYVDKAGIFGGQKRAHFSQVKRALKELNIEICMLSRIRLGLASGTAERCLRMFLQRLASGPAAKRGREQDVSELDRNNQDER